MTVKLQYFDKYAGWGPLTSAIKPSNIMPHWYHELAFKKRAKSNAKFQQYNRNISATSTCVLDIKGWPLRKGQKKRARYFHTGQLPFKDKCTFLSNLRNTCTHNNWMLLDYIPNSGLIFLARICPFRILYLYLRVWIKARGLWTRVWRSTGRGHRGKRGPE